MPTLYCQKYAEIDLSFLEGKKKPISWQHVDAPSATVHRIGWFIIANLDYFGIKRVTCMQRIVLIIISNIEMSDICVFPYIYIRDLTIRQRRRPWKRRWQIDFVSVHLFSRLFSGAQLLKRKEFGLELKRRDRARVQAEMVEFIASPFPFPSKPQKIGHFTS